MGRKKVTERKQSISLSLPQETITKLEELADNYFEGNSSKMVGKLIDDYFNEWLRIITINNKQ